MSPPEREVPPAIKRELPGFKGFLLELRKKRIIEILAGFVGGGWLTYEIVHWILVVHYHLPEKLLDITLITLAGTLLCTLTWRWFAGRDKPRKFKPELILIPLVFLLTVLQDINLILHLKEPAQQTFPASQWKNSIAVLPFIDMSPQKDQEYFCDGMTEELINRLSNIRELRVPARTSVFSFKGKAEDIREIGRKLNVEKVLEGSVRKEDSQLRITVQLVNVSDSYHIWSETFDKELTKVFAIQDEIALTVADKLKLTLLSDEKARLVKRPTENLEAYNLYLLGRYFLDRASAEEDFNKVIGYFDQALAMDPGYALAYAAQALCYSQFCMIGYLAPSEGYPRAMEAAKKAIELDEELGEAHASLGYLKMIFDWDLAGAEREFKRALKLSPGSVDIYIPYSMYLALIGRFDEAIAGFKRIVELDPANPANYVYLGAWGYQMAGRYDESIIQIKKGLDMDPSILYGQLWLASAYALKGMYREAVAQADKVLSAWPPREDVQIFSFLGVVYAVSGQKEKARSLLNRMLDLRARRYVDAYLIGEVYAGLGEKEKAFEWITKAYEEHAGQMVFIKVDPWIRNLHSDPRYKELLKKMGFEK
ncbi:MAG: tetratricopeptide repeat protein [Candidatus Aminicenantales bacterium]